MDPGALRAALERQATELAPISRVLAAAAAFPPRLSADEWRGEAAEACLRLEDDLRLALAASDNAVSAAQRSTRAAISELGG
jgi:hypothetical protein